MDQVLPGSANLRERLTWSQSAFLFEEPQWTRVENSTHAVYASTDDQTLDLQRDALKRAKCREVYEDQGSGKNASRPQLEACLKGLREGDTLVVWR